MIQFESNGRGKESSMKLPFLIGRAILGGYFVYNGINHIKNREGMAAYAGAKGVPMPEVAVPGSGVLMILGGASIILGVQPKLGIAAILTFLTSVSPVMHPFWEESDPNKRMAEMINFTKNAALAGATLALVGIEEPWPASVSRV
jgi:putative oxidoreductase